MSLKDDIVKIAIAQVGYHEGFKGGHWDNIEKYAPEVQGLEWAQGQAWCDVFVCWVAMKAGASDLYPRSASCDVSAAWFKKRGQLSEYPSIGAQIFFGSAADYTHTGIVVDYDDTYVYTVEGNTNLSGAREGDGVYRKRHVRRDPHVAAYGHPKFPVEKAPKVATGAAAAATAAAVVLSSNTSTPAKPVAPKPTPKPVVSTVKATGGDCWITLLKGKTKFTGSCVIKVKKGN